MPNTIQEFFWMTYLKNVKGTTKQVHDFFDKINKIHPALKFTMQHTSPN